MAARPRRPAPDPGCGVDGAEIDNKNKQHFFGFLLSKIGSYFFHVTTGEKVSNPPYMVYVMGTLRPQLAIQGVTRGSLR